VKVVGCRETEADFDFRYPQVVDANVHTVTNTSIWCSDVEKELRLLFANKSIFYKSLNPSIYQSINYLPQTNG